MSTQLTLMILGSILILVGILGGIKREGETGEILVASVRIPMALAGMLAIMFVGYYYGTIKPVADQQNHIYVGNKLELDFPVENTQIFSPLEGDAVECRILTMGVYPQGMTNDIWVLVRPTDNRYYPQSDHTNVSYKRNGKWQVITRFGGDEGEPFELIVYETDSVASQFFSSTIAKWNEQGSFPGLNLDEIPASAREVQRMNVTLEGPCRGVF